MSLPAGDVTQWDVTAWALDQAQYLTPTQHHVLLYLCLNAFYKTDNPERAWVGKVLSKRSEQADICFYTGLGESTVRRALHGLQDAAYIVYKSNYSQFTFSQITIGWQENMDELRAQIRTGKRDLPAEFRRPKKAPKTPVIRPMADVIDMGAWVHSDRNRGSQ